MSMSYYIISMLSDYHHRYRVSPALDESRDRPWLGAGGVERIADNAVPLRMFATTPDLSAQLKSIPVDHTKRVESDHLVGLTKVTGLHYIICNSSIYVMIIISVS